ncbi:MAG: SagB/ThcOx family dehydrogenase [Nitrospinae bacterium]|jgi:SagB-type dehydrogenase family enzyme|nr:SagB/ThcOx family dehydrogenase [Nitrospinota bacterium]MDA1109167.1 SagB/ThcOx family dehydrogenase [Nitrospinota bacterium]
MSAFDKVSRYHQSSKHGTHSFAPGPGYLDWDSQPDPFRRYEGAEVIPLKKIPPTEKPFFAEALQPSAVAASPLSFESVSQLFFDSLALSAWKSFQGSKWALRVNPSSGNLHPTEGYLISGPLQGLSQTPAIFHYSPRLHGLEVRATFPIEIWTKMLAGLPGDTIFIGLSSIYWREAWKYGLRAFRYCHHDLGHALAAINIACAGLGWRAVLLDQLGCDDLEIILGLTEKNEDEVEVPECLMAISPNEISSDWNFDKQQVLDSFTNVNWCGTPNILSKSHVAWSGIDEVSQNTKKPFTGGQPNFNFDTGSLSKRLDEDLFPLRKAIHQRRSAVAMDGRTTINRETFYQFLIKTIPEACPLPFQMLPWEPNVHLGLFVHRVDDLPKGLYFLVRNKNHLQDLKAKFKPNFLWEKPEGCPAELDLFLLDQRDTMRTAASVSCGQEIAANGCFSLGMISAFEEPLKKYGSWFYPRLYWECGAIGQVLYLQAEVSGVRSTGIGCFFDDPVHQIFGIQDMSYQSLYHFTVGGPVEDTRLTTLPPY